MKTSGIDENCLSRKMSRVLSEGSRRSTYALQALEMFEDVRGDVLGARCSSHIFAICDFSM